MSVIVLEVCRKIYKVLIYDFVLLILLILIVTRCISIKLDRSCNFFLSVE